MTLLSEIYDVTLKRGNREAAKGGFVRPTVGEHFMTHKDFEEIKASHFLPENLGFLDVIQTVLGSQYSIDKISTNTLSEGKWYIEQNFLLLAGDSSRYDGAASIGVKILNANTNNLLAFPRAFKYSGYDSWSFFTADTGDIMRLIIDVDTGSVTVYENGTFRRTVLWTGGQPIKLVANVSNHNSESIGHAKINPGPNFSFPIPEGYKAFIDL